MGRSAEEAVSEIAASQPAPPKEAAAATAPSEMSQATGHPAAAPSSDARAGGASVAQPAPTAAPPSAPTYAQEILPTRPAPQISPHGSRKIRLLVVDDIPQTRQSIIRALRFHEKCEVIGTAKTGDEGVKMALELLPDVIIMDVNMPGSLDGIAATAVIKQKAPWIEIIILTVQDDVDYMRKAMMAGARDFLAKPPMIDDLVLAITRASQHSMEAQAAREALEKKKEAQRALVQGKIITVYSPRGGAGCTTLAANLAAVMHSPETPVVIVDGSLQFGDIAVLYNLQSQFTIFDLAMQANDELELEVVEQMLARHSSGVHMLIAPRPEQAEQINSLQFSAILRRLSTMYPYVIVDTTHRLTDTTLAALDCSDVDVLVGLQDIPTIARMRKFLDLAPALNVDPARSLLVINAYDSKAGVPDAKIAQVLKTKIAATLPRDLGTTIISINRGVPFTLNPELATKPIVAAIQELKSAIEQRLRDLDAPSEEEAETASKKAA